MLFDFNFEKEGSFINKYLIPGLAAISGIVLAISSGKPKTASAQLQGTIFDSEPMASPKFVVYEGIASGDDEIDNSDVAGVGLPELKYVDIDDGENKSNDRLLLDKVFRELGFSVATGPEMEDEWHNFDALNVPKDHPARDMQDTFWIKGHEGKLLRTHCTNASVRAMEEAVKNNNLPLAVVSMGKVFRNESTDATHEMQFFQVDGVMVGKNVTLANLKYV